jgi:phosphotransferase system HPr-like phosphotransfer protein
MMLAAGPGSKLNVTAIGADGPQALTDIEGLLKRKFEEQD